MTETSWRTGQPVQVSIIETLKWDNVQKEVLQLQNIVCYEYKQIS